MVYVLSSIVKFIIDLDKIIITFNGDKDEMSESDIPAKDSIIGILCGL